MSETKLRIGDRVKVTAGEFKGLSGTIIQQQPRGWVVELENDDHALISYPMVRPTDPPSEPVSADLTKLSVIQLKELAQQRGVSVARTKEDFLRIIKEKYPEEDLFLLKGKALADRVRDLHISRLRSKQELIERLFCK